MSLLRGLIIRSQSGFYSVETEVGMLVCRLRGRLKRGPKEGDIVAIGDWVKVTRLDEATGVIEEVVERERALSRMAPTPRGEYQQIIIANPDQVVIVFACSNPAPRLGMLDRFLVICEKQKIPVSIVANKIDLIEEQQAQALFGHYPPLGYPVLYTSALTGRGVEELEAHLRGKVSVLTGPSGAGKSSLLNAFEPGLGLEVRQISQATGKGRHTTVVRQMIPLESGGYVADTPGLKALALWDVEPEEIDGYFPELRELVPLCEYNDCTHIEEPDCAVLRAVQNGTVNPERYKSYLSMRQGAEEEQEW